MNRPTLYLLLCALWAVLYLPGLGEGELKGEEGRRILPGLTMLENGDWVLPRLNDEPYLRKPPLINWTSAAAVALTGQRAEWSVRLPSVLAVLAATLVLAWCGANLHSARAGCLTGIIFLTHAALLEKGRLAEIEAIYIALSAIAFAWWLVAWHRHRRGWRLWLVPQLALALGVLAKGPLPHYLYFYGVVLAVLIASRQKRLLLEPSHFLSLALGLGVVCLWWLPYRAATESLGAGTVMAEQLAERLGHGRFTPINVPRALANGLPWILFLPLWWNRRVLDALSARDGRLSLLIRATRWPVVAGFAGIMLLNGMLPRYSLPLFPFMAILLAFALLHVPPRWATVWRWSVLGVGLAVALALPALPWAVRPAQPGLAAWIAVALAGLLLLFSTARLWHRADNRPLSLALGTCAVILAAMTAFSLVIAPRITLEDHLRPIGARVNAEVPPGAPIAVLDPGYEAALFYIERPLRFYKRPKDLPGDTRYLLIREKPLKRFRERSGAAFEVIPLHKEGKKPFFLLKLSGESETTPRPGS